MTFIVRKAALQDANAIPRIQIAGWRAAYKDIVPVRFLQNMEEQPRINRWSNNIQDMTDDTYTLVGELDGQVIGFLSAGPPREENAGFQAELWALYLDPAYWRGGYGGRMFDAMVDDLKSRGIENVYVWVLKDNPVGRGFYEKMGGTHIRGLMKTFSVDDENFEEVAYGWPVL